MKNFNLCLMLMLTLAATTLMACDEEEDTRVPVPARVSAELFDSCVSGKGWRYVESHEIKSGGSTERRDYWAGPDGGAPVQYAFGGDSITTYMYIDTYPIKGYRRQKYTYDEATNTLKAGGTEVFKVVSVSPEELRIIRYEALKGDGMKIYTYATYRAMTPQELAAQRSSHPYDLDTFNERYPTLPEQENFTAADFTRYAVGYGWKCTEMHKMETAGRYDAAGYNGAATGTAAEDYFIAADSITLYRPSAGAVRQWRRA